jgi:aryl-alcohol dehydrogenase-like predicted oxidoreductase
VQYRVLGRTGIEVSAVSLGTATFGIAPLAEDCASLVDRALDLGINFFNTATHYGNRKNWDRPGVPGWQDRASAEELLGAALKGRRSEVMITTKVGMDVGEAPNGGGFHGSGLTRRMIRQRVEMSLRRLQTDYVDFLYAQSVDRNTPLEVTLEAFDDLVHQGKVLHYGLSNFPAWQMVDAIRICERRGLQQILGQEVAYHLAMRNVEAEIVPAAKQFGLALTAFMALGGGLLTGMQTFEEKPASAMGIQRWRLGQGAGFSEREMDAARHLDSLAREWGIPAAQLALSWLLSRPTVAAVIVGPETIEELEENAPAGDLRLSAEQLAALNLVGAS